MKHRALPSRLRPFACGPPLAVALLASSLRPAAAQEFHAPLAWDIEVVGEGSPSQGAPFQRAEEGFFNDDGLLDAVVLVGDEAYVVLNPAAWAVAVPLPGSFDDLCVMEGGEGALDAILTAGADGVLLWRWDETVPETGFAALALDGEWGHPTRVDYEKIGLEDLSFGLVGAFDEQAGVLHALLVCAGVPAGNVPYHSMITSWEHDPPLHDLELVDFDGDLLPDFATLGSALVQVITTAGDVHASEAVNADRGWLAGFDPDADGKKRLACLTVHDEGHRLLVLDDAGIEDCRELPYGIGGAAFGHLNGNDSNEDLLIQTESIGELVVVEAGCDPGGTGLSFSVLPECHVPVSVGWTGPGQSATRSAAWFGDFDMDGEDEILAPNDQTGKLRWLERQPGVASGIVPVSLTADFPFQSSYCFVLDRDELTSRGATHVECVVWAWDWDLPARVSALRNTAVGYDYVDMTTLPPCDELGCTVALCYTLDFGALTPSRMLALEVRALKDPGTGSLRTIGTACYAFMEDCDLLEELEEVTGLAGYCGGDSLNPLALGDIVAGFMPIPRLPAFALRTPPVIPWRGQ